RTLDDCRRTARKNPALVRTGRQHAWYTAGLARRDTGDDPVADRRPGDPQRDLKNGPPTSDIWVRRAHRAPEPTILTHKSHRPISKSGPIARIPVSPPEQAGTPDSRCSVDASTSPTRQPPGRWVAPSHDELTT